MKEVLEKIINNSRWTYPIFDGKIIVEGRILSPSESEVVGLTSALIAKGILSESQIRQLSNLKLDMKEEEEENEFKKIFDILKNFDPDKLIKMQESQDKILETCITRASIDEGVSWQTFSVVLTEKQQSISHNRLWVGMISDSDRKEMINLCLEGHKKASETIRRIL